MSIFNRIPLAHTTKVSCLLLLTPLATATGNQVPHASSGSFLIDTRVVGPLSDVSSGNFLVDNRALDGVIGFAVSGPSSIDTGGHLMGVPIVRGINPEIVPGIDGRQWITISGTGFAEGARVVLRTGNEVFTIPTDRTQRVSDTEIRVFVNVTSAPAEWSAQVTNPGGLPSAPLVFQVGGAAVSPAGSVDFGTLAVGGTRARAFTLRNTGEQTIHWSAALGGMFTFDGPASGTLDAGDSTQLTILYTPTAPGPHAVTARFNLGGQIHQRNLTGRAETGELAAGGRVLGTVTVNSPNGELPAPNAEIRLAPSGDLANTTGLVVRTDSQGRFEITSLPSGSYELFATYQGQLIKKPFTADLQPKNVLVNMPYLSTIVLGSRDCPVVLVRGIGEHDDNEDGYWFQMRERLRDEGFVVWDPNEWRPGWNGVSGYQSTLLGQENYDVNSHRLYRFIEQEANQFQAEHGNKPGGIQFVAHSMGGLTVRRLLSQIKERPFLYQEVPPIRNVVMLGTPHAGSYLADFSETPLEDFIWRLSWLSTKSLTTAKMRNQARFYWPSDTNLFLAAGTTAGVMEPELRAGSIAINRTAPRGDRNNDGAVTVRSAFGNYLQLRDNFASRILSTTQLDNPLLYSEVSTFDAAKTAIQKEFFVHHRAILTNSSVLNWVVGSLKGSVTVGSASTPEVMEIPVASEDSDESFTGVPVDHFSLALDPAQTTSANVPLSGEGMAQWVIGLSDATAVVRLAGPDAGGWISESGPGVDWERIEDAEKDGALIVITLHEPEAGMWSIEANGAALAEAAEVSVSVAEESSLRFEADVDPLVAAGAAVPMLAAALLDDGSSTTLAGGGEVSATVLAPNGGEVSIQLTDDGQQGDGEAGDGLHGLLSEDFADPGIYYATFRFDGAHPDGGMAVRRIARAGFTRAAPGGFITEILGHQTVDASDNGYADAIIFDIRVDVTEPGDFSLSGTLVETDGSASFQAVTEFHRAEAGAGVVNLVFDPRGLPMGRESGPFVFSELRLVRAEGEREWLHDYPAAADYPVSVKMFNGFSRHLRVTGELDAGWVKVGETTTRTLRIHNDGWQRMIIGGLTLPVGFEGDFEGEIEPGTHEDVEITFTPTVSGDYGGGFDVFSDANGGATVELEWSGTGYTGILFDDWLAEQNVPVDQRGPNDDPSANGVPNLLAYLYNIPANAPLTAADRAAMPTPRQDVDESGRYLAIRYRHHRNAERLVVMLEASPDLSPDSWQAVVPDAVVELPDDAETGDFVREVRVGIEENPSRFYRLLVSEMP